VLNIHEVFLPKNFWVATAADPSSFFRRPKRVDASTHATAKCKNSIEGSCNQWLNVSVSEGAMVLIANLIKRHDEVKGMLAAPAHG